MPNPYQEDVYSSVSTSVPGVPEIQNNAFSRCIGILERLVRDGEPGFSWGQVGRTVLIAAPRAGYGKSHLVGRLRSVAGHLVAMTDLHFGREIGISWRDTLERTVRQYAGLRCPGGACALLDEVGRWFFARMAFPTASRAPESCPLPSDEAALNGQFREIFDPNASTAGLSWLDSHYDSLLEDAEHELARRWQMPLDSVRFWARVLQDYAGTASTELEKREEALREAASGHNGESPGENAEGLARRRFGEFFRLASEVRPVAFVVDHLDAFFDDSSAGMDIANLLVAIQEQVPRSVTLLCLNEDIWDAIFQDRVPSAWVDRLTRDSASLTAVSPTMAESLVRQRLLERGYSEEVANRFARDLRSGQRWDFAAPGTLYPRFVLRQACEAWEAFHAMPDTGVETSAEEFFRRDTPEAAPAVGPVGIVALPEPGPETSPETLNAGESSGGVASEPEVESDIMPEPVSEPFPVAEFAQYESEYQWMAVEPFENNGEPGNPDEAGNQPETPEVPALEGPVAEPLESAVESSHQEPVTEPEPSEPSAEPVVEEVYAGLTEPAAEPQAEEIAAEQPEPERESENEEMAAEAAPDSEPAFETEFVSTAGNVPLPSAWKEPEAEMDVEPEDLEFAEAETSGVRPASEAFGIYSFESSGKFTDEDEEEEEPKGIPHPRVPVDLDAIVAEIRRGAHRVSDIQEGQRNGIANGRHRRNEPAISPVEARLEGLRLSYLRRMDTLAWRPRCLGYLIQTVGDHYPAVSQRRVNLAEATEASGAIQWVVNGNGVLMGFAPPANHSFWRELLEHTVHVDRLIADSGHGKAKLAVFSHRSAPYTPGGWLTEDDPETMQQQFIDVVELDDDELSLLYAASDLLNEVHAEAKNGDFRHAVESVARRLDDFWRRITQPMVESSDPGFSPSPPLPPNRMRS